MRRRDLLVIGGAMGVAVALPPILRRLPSDFEFEPLPGFNGFRRLQTGDVSGGFDPFLTLADPHVANDDPYIADPCRALFGPEGGWRPGVVPVAFFTDINCPYCKVLERQLARIRDADGTLDLYWHEFPLLGPRSERAARATLAARALGVEAPARAYLASGSFPPGPVGLARLAEAVGVAAADLTRVASSQDVTAMLRQSMNLGRALGIFGTPGTVIGRTLVIGALKPADLHKLLALELAEAQPVCL